jgi:hypothetical protein
MYDEAGLRTIVIEWWGLHPELSTEVYGGKPHTPGHGALEETALNMAYNPKLIEQDLYKRITGEKLGYQEREEGYSVFPGIASMGLPSEKGEGFPNFDVAKANEYAQKVAKSMAAMFTEAIQRWDWIASHHPSAPR